MAARAAAARADVLTGDQQSNLYRGYFGRRYGRGEALQLSAEQLNVQPTSRLPSADGRSYMLRGGAIRGPWRAEVMGMRVVAGRAFDWSDAARATVEVYREAAT